MKIIAVTGGIGSGKSTVSNEFKKLGAYVVDTDAISHEIMMRGYNAYDMVVAEFGNGILSDDLEIDRKRLADIVFNDKKKLETLNSIMHKEIYAELQRRIEASDVDIVCAEIPLLFTAKCPIEIDVKVVVSASDDVRIRRVMLRDNCSADKVKERMANQLSDSEMCKLADVVIVNNGDIDLVREQVKAVFDSLA